jgi:hypothetical protein
MAAATIVPPACKPPLSLLLPLLLTRRSVSVHAAPPRQQHHRQRPPPSRRHPPRGHTRPRPPAPPDHDDDYYDDDDEQESRFAGGTRAAAMPKPPAASSSTIREGASPQPPSASSLSYGPASSLSLADCELNSHSGKGTSLCCCRLTTQTTAPWSASSGECSGAHRVKNACSSVPSTCMYPSHYASIFFFMNKCHGALVLLPPKFSQFPVSGLCRSSRAQISVAGLLYAST